MSSTTPSLTDELFSHLQGAPLQQIAQQLGTDTEQTHQAIGAALPLLLGALGRNTAEPQGAQALFGALQRDHAAAGGGAVGAGGGFDVGGLLGSLLGGLGGGRASTGGSNGGDGGAILGHIFGGARPQAEAGLGQATGLDSGKAAQLLKVLAPIVLSFLAQRVRQGGLDAGGLGSTLGQEHQRVQQRGGLGGGLLGLLFDRDGDGQVGLSDLIKIGGGLFGKR